MSTSRKVGILFLTMIAIFYTPYFGLLIKKKGKIPPDFFHFPSIEAVDKPGLHWLAITIASALFLLLLLVLAFPRLFGFKKDTTAVPPVKKAKLPLWFWIGLVLWVAILIVFAAKLTGPKWVVDWALIPLWWGFILMLDGIVYARSGGKSMMKNATAELIAMGILSISGWLIFEYFNFFIETNWYYPAAKKMSTPGNFLLYAVIGSSAFIPMAFEWYQLLRTFPALNKRFTLGKKVSYSKTTRIILLIIGFVIMFFLGYLPNGLFYGIWLGPLTIMITVLTFLDIWTPFKSIRDKGDWTPFMLMTIVWILQGFCVEWWNHLSYRQPQFIDTANPGYWEYCIPYVDFWCIFNMPFLGYLGYAPFSMYCFIYVIIMSNVMNIKMPFSLGKESQ